MRLPGQKYMNPETGSVDEYDGWWYENEYHQTVNAVDEGAVVPVVWDADEDRWRETPPGKFVHSTPLTVKIAGKWYWIGPDETGKVGIRPADPPTPSDSGAPGPSGHHM